MKTLLVFLKTIANIVYFILYMATLASSAAYVFIYIMAYLLNGHNIFGELGTVIAIALAIILSQYVLQTKHYGYHDNHPSCFTFPFKLKH